MRFRLIASAVVAAVAMAIAPGCSLGEGKGSVSGELDIHDCWAGGFDLKPDFFAAIPYRETQLILRIQNGGDYQEFSDGLSIEVDDVNVVRTELNTPLRVALSPEVTPPGVPVKAVPDPAPVHAALYLQRTCRVQNVALYAVDAVTLNANGGCADDPALDGGSPVTPQACGALGVSDAGPFADAAPSDAGAPVVDASFPPDAASPAPRKTASSWVRFRSISNANPDESDASQRLNDADFELFLADPREICPGGLGAPPPCRGHLVGNFKFYFQRGKPAQPFP